MGIGWGGLPGYKILPARRRLLRLVELSVECWSKEVQAVMSAMKFCLLPTPGITFI